MKEPLIKAKNLSKHFGGEGNLVKVLDDVCFEVFEKEIIGLSGSSGSGKTTLLSIIGGLEYPSSGVLEIFGNDINNLGDEKLSRIRLQDIGFIFQEHNLLPALTVEENIELPLTLLRVSAKERKTRVKDLLETVDLGEYSKRFPSQLSRGQRQRIAAVRAFVTGPRLILADEPTSDLDPDNARVLTDFLRYLNSVRGTTVIVAATDMMVFEGYATRTLKLVNGKIE
jgi:ABC-type lipoprotein export system ATPase subunit